MNTVIDYLKNAAAAHPAKTALADHDHQITYQAYWETAQRIGSFLRKKGCYKQAVGVWAKRNAFTPILLMGVCCSGNFYVPLDPDMPAEKRNKIILLSKMDTIIMDRQVSIPPLGSSCNQYSLEEINADSTLSFSYAGCSYAHDPLSLIYTSGSTGTPKGVLKTHGAVIDFLEAFTETFALSENEIIGNQTPFCFDASTKDLYLSLKLGATLVILETGLFSFPVRLIEYMNMQKVTTIFWVPSALSLVTQLNTFSEILPETLKNVFFVGETFPMKQLNKWRKALPSLQYVNLYGSTEIAGVCCYYKISPDDHFANTDVLPIGKPFKNCNIRLVSDGIIITSENTSGEICVESNALAKEYFDDPEATKATFIDNPLDKTFARRYLKTGDIAHYDQSGNLVFETRKDFQVKHMGHRIELGEIETAALALDAVEMCGCIYDSSKNKIILYCQLQKENPATGREILHLLRSCLSPYMLPNKVIIIDKIPQNANGKIDRPALKRLTE